MGGCQASVITRDEIEIKDNTITATKQRDMESGKPIGFELETVTLGQNPYGEDVTSCTLRIVDAAARKAETIRTGLKPREALVLAALRQAIEASVAAKGPHAATEAEWRLTLQEIQKQSPMNSDLLVMTPGRWSEAFRRSRDALAGQNAVMSISTNEWVAVG